ncbi:mediator of RNA polymerase II transcription subunit 6 [Suhomyces tanzawaensis NRRL Y-17324]|uniref:Mediator of RNA polymerase II transcription subunit 6 n=1 Tax=Suhomyces tanzawaensis NRRL Y-17324 TaxID=984487 RepID=A0A1E4SIL8_9ASCO|nr:mediator of RNA polymerase II transcription subunit 6 [Suhomyces tanzawaensis NRRL Y-17324]ODV79287.1 mediator of RNA polymerase II transcription subunit 6 [Suhomyces tanzawaensis NRRL Y-17324]
MAEQLDEIQWKSPEFIQERGLHTGNVLEYFALSPFYDRTSNNQVLMMQFQFQQIQIPIGVSFHQYFQNRLLEMTGVEFVIAYNREPDFWIIRKQRRLDANSTLTLQDYYIIGANVYQAPKIYDALSSRLLSSVLLLKNSIDLLNNMTKYQILDGGHSYNNAQPVASTPSTSQPKPPVSATPVLHTPQTVGGSAGTVDSVSNQMSTNEGIEITSSAFNNLLNNVVQAAPSIYLDDIPLYGKGSTVEMLGLKVSSDP